MLGQRHETWPSPDERSLFSKHHISWFCHDNFRSDFLFQVKALMVVVRTISVFLKVGSPAAISSSSLNIALFCYVSGHSLFIKSGMSLTMQEPQPKLTAIRTWQNLGEIMRIQVCLLGPLERVCYLCILNYMKRVAFITLDARWIDSMAKYLKYSSYEATYPHISSFKHFFMDLVPV